MDTLLVRQADLLRRHPEMTPQARVLRYMVGQRGKKVTVHEVASALSLSHRLAREASTSSPHKVATAQ